MTSLGSKQFTEALRPRHTPVCRLGFPCGPVAIIGAIVCIVIATFKRQIPVRFRSHVVEEEEDGKAPPLTNLDSPRTIIIEGAIFGVVASGDHIVPSARFRAKRRPVDASCIPKILCDVAATTRRFKFKNPRKRSRRFPSTGASESPKCSFAANAIKRDRSEPTKRLTCNVLAHGRGAAMRFTSHKSRNVRLKVRAESQLQLVSACPFHAAERSQSPRRK
jgi:hypothetical protein